MNRTATLLLFATLTIASTGSALADAMPPGLDGVFKAAQAAIRVPPEWDGVWAVTESTYTCAGAVQSTDASTDTMCAGQTYTSSGGGITLTCTGTATATTIDATCSGSGLVFTDCTADFTVVTHGTLSGDTFFTVSVLNVTFSGTGAGCDLLTPMCDQVNRHGTRQSAAPTDYCLTPTLPATWGRLRLRYR